MRVQQHPAAAAPLCRDLLPKGFTGKGEAIRWRNDLIVAVAQVHAAMTTLHRATGAVRSRFFYLERFRRNQTGAVTLRWRQTSGRYVTWLTLQSTVRQLPTPLREWYAEAQRRASWLNAQECALRHALGMADRLLHEWSAPTEGGNDSGRQTSSTERACAHDIEGKRHEQ